MEHQSQGKTTWTQTSQIDPSEVVQVARRTHKRTVVWESFKTQCGEQLEAFLQDMAPQGLAQPNTTQASSKTAWERHMCEWREEWRKWSHARALNDHCSTTEPAECRHKQDLASAGPADRACSHLKPIGAGSDWWRMYCPQARGSGQLQ
jgi:hypothetical protein